MTWNELCNHIKNASPGYHHIRQSYELILKQFVYHAKRAAWCPAEYLIMSIMFNYGEKEKLVFPHLTLEVRHSDETLNKEMLSLITDEQTDWEIIE